MSELHLPHAHDAGGNPAVHHETSDVNIRAILGFGKALEHTASYVAGIAAMLRQGST